VWRHFRRTISDKRCGGQPQPAQHEFAPLDLARRFLDEA
jgi:hypothetical protein